MIKVNLFHLWSLVLSTILCCMLPAAEISGPPLEIDPSSEFIYGVRYEIRGADGVRGCPAAYETRDRQGRVLQREQFDDHKYGLFCVDLSQQWQESRLEVFTKRGAKWLSVSWAAAGAGSVEVRRVRMVKGGFPSEPPLVGTPYLSWIESLVVNREFARRQPLLEIRSGGESLWSQSSRQLGVSAEEVQALIGEAQPYLAVTPLQLAAMMPTRRGMYFSGGDPAREGGRFHWDPREPDTLRLKDGKVFDFAKIYPITGYEEVRVPSGKIVRYPYHDPPGTVHLANVRPQFLEPPAPPQGRIYLDGLLTETRVFCMLRASYIMAILYRATDNAEYGSTFRRDPRQVRPGPSRLPDLWSSRMERSHHAVLWSRRVPPLVCFHPEQLVSPFGRQNPDSCSNLRPASRHAYLEPTSPDVWTRSAIRRRKRIVVRRKIHPEI